MIKHKTLLLFSVCMAFAFASCSSIDDTLPPDPGPGPGPGPNPVVQNNYYVSPLGSDSNNGLTSSAPFKTIAKALDMIKPGVVVNLMNGTYDTSSGPFLTLQPKHSGEADKYVTIKAMDGHKPLITAYGNVWNAVDINASYVILDGLELQGYNQHLTYEDAYKVYTDYIAGNRDWAKIASYNTNGINIGGPGKDSKLPHHVIVRNCVVHDFPGGGISGIQADYITIENNTVYNNAWYTMYGCSGISILCPYNSDNLTDYKIIISGNLCHTNQTLVPWNSQQKLSDGNGIIIDINVRPYDGGVIEDTTPYTGRTLVKNNVSVNNGGSGIHSFKAAHVDIYHNTAFNNGRKVGYADIHSNQCQDVNIKNNIMYANADNACNEKPGNATEVYDYNIYFGGKVNYQGPHDLVADPKFVNVSLDRIQGDFHLQTGSPGIGSGSDGKNRGAYE